MTESAVVIGSGPNGLAAAAALSLAGLPVTVLEGDETIGGGLRTAEITLPGYRHDICSAIHPLGVGSPFLRTLPLHEHGLEWVHPPVPLAHPFDDGTAALLERSPVETARTLDGDAGAYLRLVHPFLRHWEELAVDLLAPLHLPRHPLLMARFGLDGIMPAALLARLRFEGSRARALFAGLSAHSFLPLESPPSAAFGLVLGLLGHSVGWPFPRGGSLRIAEALAGFLLERGATVVTGVPVHDLGDVAASLIMLDLGPPSLLRLGGDRLGTLYRRRLGRYRYGPGVFKIDWALSEPIPWRAPECRRAGTVHLGGTMEEIAAGERVVCRGEHAERPFVLVAQQSVFDETRAPAGRHTGWAYCHVPAGSDRDMSDAIEAQVERFAPGFRDTVLARHTRTAAGYERYNPNFVGGDINGGVQDLAQLFFRPVLRAVPYATGIPGVWLCSSSTPPGGGVHGMCGWHAAQAALRELRRR